MTKLLSILEAQKVDQVSNENFGLSGEILMESAGVLASHKIQELYLKGVLKKERGISVFCGPGNNGGDGLVLARHLYSSGFKNLKIFVLQSKGRFLFELQLERLRKQKIEVLNLEYKKNAFSLFDQKISQVFLDTFLIVDALFGVGFKDEIRDLFLLSLIEKVNQSKKFVVSLDVPSGLDANTGSVKGQSILAHHTLTFGFAKPGFYVGEGVDCVGKVEVLNPGFPIDAMEKIAKSYFLVNRSWVREALPQRKNQSHKYDYGLLLVFAGSAHQWGAGVLLGSAAYRVGAGLVFWASYEEPPLGEVKKGPEIQTLSVKDVFNGKDFKTRFWDSKRTKSIALGPGLGIGKNTAQLILNLKKRIGEDSSFQVVLDADAIRTCSQFKLFPLPAHWILTPHADELAGIFQFKSHFLDSNEPGIFLKLNDSSSSKDPLSCMMGPKGQSSGKFTESHSVQDAQKKKRVPSDSVREAKEGGISGVSIKAQEIMRDRFSFILKASQITGCSLLLKGHHSVMVSEGKCFVIPTGNPLLAKAGSGDVLTGMIGGLMAQGLSGVKATLVASYLHGFIADEWVKTKGENLSLNPSDLKDSFSLAFKNIF